MTHPLTLREAVEYWLDLALTTGANKQDFNMSEAVAGVMSALASGSGDHAEMARLADLLDLYAAAREDEFTVEDVQLIDRGSVLISAILAEIAALRAENDVLEVERIGLRSAIFGSHDYDPGLRHGGFIEMARTTEDARRGAVARAIEAERKLAEAEQVIRDIAETPYTGADWPRSRAATYIASKEAERG